MDIDVAMPGSATIGESPTWVGAEKAIYWIDVKAPALYRLQVETNQQTTWNMPSDIGGFALNGDSTGAVVALRQGLHSVDFHSGRVTPLAPPPFDPARFRFNEGACDSRGRFWIGVMFDPLNPDAVDDQDMSSLHSFTLRDGYRREPDAATLHNGIAWSPDGSVMYLSHSQSGTIYQYAYDLPSGRMSDKQIFAEIPKEQGVPDGAAVDTDGGYWCALHGAGRVRRYLPDGRVDCDIALPVSQPTMCAFGGDGLADLYMTSATDGLSAEQRGSEPLAGSIFRARTGRRGCHRHHVIC